MTAATAATTTTATTTTTTTAKTTTTAESHYLMRKILAQVIKVDQTWRHLEKIIKKLLKI